LSEVVMVRALRGKGIGLCALLLSATLAWTAAPTAQAQTKKTDVLRVFFIDGQVVERGNPWNVLGLDRSMVFPKLIAALDRDSQQTGVRTLLIRLGASSLGLSQCEELADALLRARARGKRVVLHADSLSNLQLVAATAASRVNVAPEGSVVLTGLQIELSYYKDLLQTLGLEADIEAIGRYKAAAEPMTRNTISSDAKKALDTVVDSLFQTLRDRIVRQRRLKEKEVDALFNRGVVSAVQAKKARLITTTLNWAALLKRLKASHGGLATQAFPPKSELPDFSSIFSLFKLFSSKKGAPRKHAHQIAVLVAEGTITEGHATGSPLGSQASITTDDMIRSLDRLERDEHIKAVVIRIDSPGGSALASDIIWHRIAQLARTKPVVASLGNVAASGGYYIASAARRIVAHPSSITGSIGVFGGKLVFKKMLDKVGVNTVILGRGTHAGLYSPLSRFSTAQRKVVRREMQRVYDTFVNRVAKGRRMSYDAVHRIAQGRVWTGKDAKAIGLVDDLGGLDTAIRRATTLARLKLSEIEVVHYPEPKSFMDLLRDERHMLQSPGLNLHALLPDALAAPLKQMSQTLFVSLRKGGVMAALPFHLGVR
jgi:protease-4